MAVFCAPSVSACGRCWMLMDGVCWWCSTWCCLILLLTGLWHGDSKSAGKDALLLHTFTGTSLACYKLVCFWWLCMLSFLSFFVFGRERVSQARRCRRCGKTSSIKADKTKNATEDESNLQTHACKQMKTTCHTCLQASLHKHKTAGNKERQQENEESGQK